MPLDPELDPHFEEAGRLNNLDPMLLRALASGESGGNAIATSRKGAGGLMQIMPGTARDYKIADPYDPVQAIYGAANILNDHLTKAEAAQAAGANINPTDEALRSYFAGSGGGNRGPETAAYPGYIAQKYLALQNGQEPPAPAPVSRIDQLAAAKATPMPAPGAVATNATPPVNAPDTFAPAPERVAALAALSGQGTAPTLQVRLASALEPGLTDQEADARRAAGAQAENAMLLDPNLNPSAAGRAPPAITSAPGGTNGIVPAGAPQQVAQAAPDPEIADLLAANRKMFGGAAQQGAQPAASAAPQAVAPNVNAPAQPREVVPLADPANAMFPASMIPQLMTYPAGQAIAFQIQQLEKEGIQLNKDGSQSIIKGGIKDPALLQQSAGATASGAGAGSIPSEQAKADITAKYNLHPFVDPETGLPGYVDSAGHPVKGPDGKPVIASNPYLAQQEAQQKEASTNAASGRHTRALADEFVAAYKDIQNPGAGQNRMQDFRKMMQQVGTITGVQPSEALMKTTSSGEAANFISQQLVAQAAREMSPRLAQQLVQQINQVKLSGQITPQGVDKIYKMIYAGTQENQDKQKFMNEYYNGTHPTFGGAGRFRNDAEYQFNALHPASAYSFMANTPYPPQDTVQAIELLRKNPNTAPAFDAHFGEGAAKQVLGR
jgi:hypothetical protein